MDALGPAELTLIAVGVLAVMAAAVGLRITASHRDASNPLRRARRVSVVRAVVSTEAALAVFAVTIVAHIENPLLQGAPFVLGPLAAAVAGLGAFTLMPLPTLDGPVRRRSAGLEPRRLADYSTVGQRRGLIVTAVAALLVVVLCGVLSAPAGDGRWLCTSLFSAVCPGSGPYLFPGWLLAGPAAILVLLLCVVVRLALDRIVLAPAAIWPELSDEDAGLRANAARFVLRFAGSALALTAGLLLSMAAIPLVNAPVLKTGLVSGQAAVLQLVGLVVGVASILTLVVALLASVRAVVGLLALSRTASVAAMTKRVSR